MFEKHFVYVCYIGFDVLQWSLSEGHTLSTLLFANALPVKFSSLPLFMPFCLGSSGPGNCCFLSKYTKIETLIFQL